MIQIMGKLTKSAGYQIIIIFSHCMYLIQDKVIQIKRIPFINRRKANVSSAVVGCNILQMHHQTSRFEAPPQVCCLKKVFIINVSYQALLHITTPHQIIKTFFFFSTLSPRAITSTPLFDNHLSFSLEMAITDF